MKTRTKVVMVTTLVAVPAFVLGPVLFPPADIGAGPTASQLPHFLFLAAGDALLLGLGISFLLFGFPALRNVSPDSKLRAWAMYLSIGYMMVSWWPHLNLHAHNGMDLGRAPLHRLLLRFAPWGCGRGSGPLFCLPGKEPYR